MEGFTLSRWHMKFGSTPGASYGLHANTSTFSLRNSSNHSFSCKGSLAPTWKNLFRSSTTITLSKSSRFTSSAGLSKGNAGGFNCYNPLLMVAEVSASGRCCIAVTRHCRAATWFPTISNTWPSDGYFTFWCRVDETAPRVWSQCLPIIAMYGEKTSTTMKSTSTTSIPVCTSSLIYPFGATILPSKLTRGEL